MKPASNNDENKNESTTSQQCYWHQMANDVGDINMVRGKRIGKSSLHG